MYIECMYIEAWLESASQKQQHVKEICAELLPKIISFFSFVILQIFFSFFLQDVNQAFARFTDLTVLQSTIFLFVIQEEFPLPRPASP